MNLVNKKTKKFSILILIVTLFMGIGYASVNSVLIGFSGNVIAKETTDIFITDVKYFEDNNANVENSKILNAYQTNLNSSISLSNTDSSSSITYKITAYNSSNNDYQFVGVEYLFSEETYSNENIIFETSLNKGDIVKANEEIEFFVTFSYLDGELAVDNTLKSLLNFKFELLKYVVVNFDGNGGVVDTLSKSVIFHQAYGTLPEYPELKDHIFDGWYTEKDGGEKITSTSIVNIDSNHTLYAHWESSLYNDVIQGIIIKNTPDENNDGVIDSIYLSFKCSETFEKYNITLKNLVVGQKYRLSYTASNNASFGDIESGYRNSMYGSIITKNAVLDAGNIKQEAIEDGGLIAQWSDRSKGDEWLNGPFDMEMEFIAEASEMYWTWDFGLIEDGILYDFNITNIVLEPVIPEINFANKNLIIKSDSNAKIIDDVSDSYSTNFIFYGEAYPETMYYPITNLISGSTYTITFEHTFNGLLIDDSSQTSNIKFDYGTGIMNSKPTAYGSLMSDIGSYASNTHVIKTVTGQKETVTLTFTATGNTVYWVWNMANCEDFMNNEITIKVTNFSASHKNGGKFTYYNIST